MACDRATAAGFQTVSHTIPETHLQRLHLPRIAWYGSARETVQRALEWKRLGWSQRELPQDN